MLRRSLSTHGIVLSSSFLRTSTSRSDMSDLDLPVDRAESRRASISRSCFEDPVPVAANSSATTANTAINTIIAIRNISAAPPLSSIDLGYALKQTGRQEDGGRPQLLKEARADAARFEDAEHVAVGANAFLLEAEDLLHTDHVLFHARDL